MIWFPQMAPSVTNRRANKYSNFVGQLGDQSGGRSLLVEASGRFSKRNLHHSTTKSGGEAEGLVGKSGKDSIVDPVGNLVASQPSVSRGRQPKRSIYERDIKYSRAKDREKTPEADRRSVETSQESEPVRPAKRRRVAKAVEEPNRTVLSSPIKPANKRGRKPLVDTITKYPISKERGLPLSQKDQIEDSFEESRPLESNQFAHVVVEIPVYENFDRDAYALVSVSSTQSTSISQSETPYHFLQAQQDPSPFPVSDIIIPDSQELLGDTSTESSRRDTTTRLSRGLTETRIPNSSNVEEKGLTIEASSPFQVSAGAYPTDSALPIEQNPGSNSTESWQGAQIAPLLELSASQIPPSASDFDIFQDDTENQSGGSQQELSQNTSKDSILSQRDVNSQHSGSQTKISKSVTPGSRHKSHHVEHLNLEKTIAIENVGNFTVGGWYQSPQRPLSPYLNQSHRLETSDSNLPPRPHTPLDCEMAESAATSASSKMSFAELATQARDRVRARFEVQPAATSIELLPSSPTPNLPQQMLPVRESITGMPLASMEESPDDEEQPSETAETTLSLPRMKPSDHVILLPLASMVRNVYKATITNRKREIMAFLNSEDIDPKLLELMDAMVEELKMLTDHQDLITEMSLTQSNVPDEHQAKWAETCSTKCLFLRYFLDNMRREEKHIAILARPGRMLDILESILKVNGIIYDRPDRSSQSNNRAIGPLRVTLLPTGLGGGQYVVNRADVVIAFDETFFLAERYSKILRTHLYEPGKLSPLISLVVAYSAEHFELCLPKFDDPTERKICLVNFIAQKRDKVGDLDEGLLEPQQAAAAAAQYLRVSSSTWPLPENPDITGLEVSDPSHLRQLQSGLIAHSQDQELSPAMTPHGPTKRTLRAESISGPDIDKKRMRIEPTRGVLASSGDVTRVSDTLGHGTQVLPTSTDDTAYEAIAKVHALDEERSRYISSLLEKVDNFEIELQKRQRMEEQLRSTVKALEARLEDYVSTLKKLEPKLLQAIADRRKFQAERDAAKSQAATLSTSMEARVTEVTKLKEDKINLEKELATARTALANSTVPEIAQLAQTQEQLRTLQADKERLEKRILSMQKDFEFTRDSYQKASSYTTELRNELSELQEHNATLQRKASENTVRVAEIQRENEAKEREERIDELEALLRDRDQELRKKTEELKIKTNGRRETRGTSVPRSPRMGSGAMSPRTRFTQTAGGSRSGSPAPGDAREGFRDTTLFPSSALAGARWSHLSDR